MAFEKYGGYTWSDEAPPEPRDWRKQGLALGVVAGLGGLGAYGSVLPRQDGTRLIDDIASVSRTVGNLSPFQMLNTFRVPELLSPFTSPAYQELTPTGTGTFTTSWDAEYLRSGSTYDYLKEATGASDELLEQAGLKFGAGRTEASSLIFERTNESATGRLYTKIGDKETTLSKSIMLQQFTGESPDLVNLVDKTKSVNRAAYGTMQSMNMWGKSLDFKPFDVFHRRNAPEGDYARPKFFPVPALGIEGGFSRGTTLARALPAMSMERFNRLLEGFVEGTMGKPGEDFFKRLIGPSGIGVTPGKGSTMFMRFGTKAAGLGAIGIGIAQLDWIRRQGSTPGEVFASAGISAGAAFLAQKASKNGKVAFATGVASFFGQMILPGFDKGLLPGMATVYARSSELRANDFNPVNYYRRTLEGFLPGVTGWETGALLGVGVVTASYMGTPSGKALPQTMLDFFGHKRFGIAPTSARSGKVVSVAQPLNIRQLYWQNMLKMGQSPTGDKVNGLFDPRVLGNDFLSVLNQDIDAAGGYINTANRYKILNAYRKSGTTGVGLSRVMNNAWSEAEELHKNLASKNPMNDALLDHMDVIGAKYSGSTIFDKIGRNVEGLAAQWKHAFFGATIGDEATALAIRQKGIKVPLGRLGILFAGTTLMHQVITGGLFGSMETSEQLHDMYSGRELVEVGKSRWWEGGGTPFEGSKTSYYRPHWYALATNRVRERGIWGADEDSISPLGKFFRKNFTYELERKTYHDRPYPISSAAFSDIPIIGGVLGATIGRVVKPPKLMHSGEWIRPSQEGEGYETADVYEGWKREPAYNLGAAEPGMPTSPFNPINTAAFVNYQFRELEGMTGWAKNVISDLVIGTDTYFTGPQLAESGMMTSPRLRFWESATGGAFFMNEAVRRIFPNYRNEIDRRNPIANTMPSWLPDKFHYGDPYRSIEWGEARLPGAGYAALHPSLNQIDPEDYPLIYQYDILGNVAPYSKEFRRVRDRMYRMRQNGKTTAGMNQWMDQIDSMVREKMNVYDFEHVHENAIQLPGSGITQKVYAGMQTALRKTVAPLEYSMFLAPRPVAKLMGDRDPIERYEFERLYGTPYGFWDKPVRDWARPAAYSALHLFGFEGKPAWKKEADANAAYFDRLKFEKWMRLADEAGQRGDQSQKIRYEYMAGNTRAGVNPQGNPLSIYWTLPQEERAFFNSFAYAQGKDRERIKQMIPGDQKHLYEAVWSRLDEGDPTLWAGIHTGPDSHYMREQFYGLQNQTPPPPEDWIGWHEDVDIGDVRVRYVDEIGKDLHDYGLWENQLRTAQSQPYLDGSTDYLHASGGINRSSLYNGLYSAMQGGGQAPSLIVNSSSAAMGRVDIEYNDSRDYEMYKAMQEQMNGY